MALGTWMETKDGVKKVNYLDSKTAARVLTPEGFSRYIEGKLIRLQDFKTRFLENCVRAQGR